MYSSDWIQILDAKVFKTFSAYAFSLQHQPDWPNAGSPAVL